MKAILRSGVLALAIMALAVPVNAGSFEDGETVFQRGEYATALKIRWPFLRPLAEQGDAAAQYDLGLMYHIATAAGSKNARMNRDKLAKLMAPDQIAEAQRMAREWMAKHQQRRLDR